MLKSPILFAIVCIVALRCEALSSFGIGIPVAPLNTAAQNFVPAVEAYLKAVHLPDHCCYDNVGMKHVHLNFIGLKIDESAVSATVSLTSSPEGLKTSFGGKMKEDFFVRLCLHADPFGKGCSTLHGCKGNVYVIETGNGAVSLKVAADPKGELSIVSGVPSFNADPVSSNMCSKLKGQVDGQLKALDAAIVTAISNNMPHIIAEILKYEPHPVIDLSLFSVHWMLDSSTRTEQTGIVLQGSLEVLDKAGKATPFQPRAPIPDVSTLMSTVTNTAVVAVADSVFSNVMYTFYEDMQLSFNYTTSEFLNTSMLFDISVTQPPTVNFTTDPAPNATKVILHGTLLAFSPDGKTSLFNAVYQLTLDVDIKLTAEKTLLAQVAPDNVTVSLTFVDYKPFDKSILEHFVIYELQTNVIPLVNSLLEANPIALPTFKALTLSNSRISFGNGYMLLQAEVAYNPATLDMPATLPGLTIACPNIPGAHQDKCI